MSETTRRVVLAAALIASGCDGDEEGAAPPGVAFDKPPGDDKPAGAQPEVDDRRMVLDNGFVPDPHVIEGTAVGTRDAGEIAQGCTGFVSTEPDATLEARGTFAELRILAHSAEDITLVVEPAEGPHVCADDTEGTDPVITAQFGPGIHRIWIGTRAPAQPVAYRLGVSELADVTAASLAR